MDKSTRINIQRATQTGRTLLERIFSEQLEGAYDILLDGSISEQPGSHLSERQKVEREKLVAAVPHKRSTGLKAKEAVDAYLREAAFTTLNRFVALKTLEARQLVQECVSKGEDSSGFKEFTALAPGLVAVADKGYRLYIETLFDEIGQEIKVLFDRRDVASLLWPNRQTLLELLGILNAPELANVWGEDETIGWVYQYFNSDEERSKMRAESQAPRNSQELAVRNQFFTPRYVVQFLTDNTLGRTWYEMMQGETKLAHIDYLVHRQNEVFLAAGKSAPVTEEDDSDLSQEELLQQPAYVPFRAKKDPRDLRILDPACGSGHFLLYAFELLISIYEEAWSDSSAAAFAETGTKLRADYDRIDELRRAMPELILRHNLHGVDIDPRAAQIAALALWMRAQRAYNEFEVGRAERPFITKTNIVVAEPMPGDSELVDEFAASLKPTVLGDLFKTMVEEMKLAGELGSLLKIEESIAKAVKEAEEARRQGSLFAGKLESQDFWDSADEKIFAALGCFAESATGSEGIRRQLFAGDAAQGVAFIELMRKRFDAVLMNPPFGLPAQNTRDYLRGRYPVGWENLLCGFIARAFELAPTGFVGAILDATWSVKKAYEAFRRNKALAQPLFAHVHLGWGVLDANVETAISVWKSGNELRKELDSDVFAFGCNGTDVDRVVQLRKRCQDYNIGVQMPRSQMAFLKSPNAVVLHSAPAFVYRLTRDGGRLPERLGEAFIGMKPADNTRFLRLHWEVQPQDIGNTGKWTRCQNGSPFSPFYFPCFWVVRNSPGFRHLAPISSSRTSNSDRYGQAGLTYGKRTNWMYAFPMAAGGLFTNEGQAIFPTKWESVWELCGYLNTVVAQEFINQFAGQHKESGYVNLLSVPQCFPNDFHELSRQIVGILQNVATHFETAPHFQQSVLGTDFREQAVYLANAVARVHELHAQLNAALTRSVADREEVSGSGQPTAVDYLSLFGGRPFDGEKSVLEMALSQAVGVTFGRFDIRQLMTAQTSLPAETVFDELPPISPMQPPFSTQAQSGETTRDDGILVNDVGHPLDLGKRVLEILQICHDGIQVDEVGKVLGVGESGLGGWLGQTFFDNHLHEYSISRRKAPIYWQLATPSASYSVWCYYHRLTRDTFFRVANDYVTPKIDHEERKLSALRQEAGPDPSSKQRKAIDAQETFVAELRAFKTEVTRIAPLWNPSVDDGVIINFAPLWRLVPQHKPWQKECKKVWDCLVNGDYDWSHLAMRLWPEPPVSG